MNRTSQDISVRLLVKMTTDFSATIPIKLCESSNEMRASLKKSIKLHYSQVWKCNVCEIEMIFDAK